MNNYIQADQQLHRLCQIIAKANRSFVPEKEDDSHTNLGFNPDTLNIEGRWIETNSINIRLVLRLTDVCLVWQNESGDALQTISTAKKNITEIEEQVEETLERFQLDTKSFREPLHFEIPEYAFMNQPVALLSRLALNEWIFWRTLANQACAYLLDKLNRTAEIRIWPHHFDTGIYVEIDQDYGIGFGLAIKDYMVGAPYFYATLNTANQSVNYAEFDKLSDGIWLHNDWKGAVLSINKLSFRNQEYSTATTKTFIDEVMECYMQ